MNVQSALKSQYHAALKTLRSAVEKCPDALWDDPADGAARFWRIVYHTLFYTRSHATAGPAVLPSPVGQASRSSEFVSMTLPGTAPTPSQPR